MRATIQPTGTGEPVMACQAKRVGVCPCMRRVLPKGLSARLLELVQK